MVVGAGPAGMGTAYYAARLGLDVILLEKEQFPRDRICGDGLLAQTVSEMERLGLGDWLLEKHHGRINGLAVRTKTASFAEALPPDPRGSRGFVVRRREFEPKILERVRASGALFRDGVEVTRLLRSPAGAMLGAEARELESGDSLRFEAPLVAVAAGFGGVDGLVEGGNRGLAAMLVSRQYFADAPDPGGPNGPFPKGYLHVWYTDGIPELGVGYGRIFFLGNGSANVGVAVYGRNLPGEASVREDALRGLHEAFLSRPEVAEMLSSAAPEEPMQSRTFAAGGYSVPRHEAGLLRVGDAGGTSHPTSGEGIGFSLEAGRLAAGWTAEAKRQDDFSTALLSGYARQLKGLSSLRQPSTHAVASLVNRLPYLDLMEPVFAGCETNGRLRRTLLECLIGNKDASTLLYRHPAASARAAGAALRKALRAS